MQHKNAITRGMRDYVTGKLWEIYCVCVLSRIGKVAAAATVTSLIERCEVTHIIFTGVAGGAAQHLIQHDMDASLLVPRFEVPLTGLHRIDADGYLNAMLTHAAENFIEHDFDKVINDADQHAFHLKSPRVPHGLIASGDEFITCNRNGGAAVAQVCFEFGIPFAVIRTISDKENADASVDFKRSI